MAMYEIAPYTVTAKCNDDGTWWRISCLHTVHMWIKENFVEGVDYTNEHLEHPFHIDVTDQTLMMIKLKW